MNISLLFFPFDSASVALFIMHPLKWWWSLFQLNSKAPSYVRRQTESRPFVAASGLRAAYHPPHSAKICCVVNLHSNLMRALSLYLLLDAFFSHSFLVFFFCFLARWSFDPISHGDGSCVQPSVSNTYVLVLLFLFFATAFTDSDSQKFVREFFFRFSVFKWIKLKYRM